MATELHVIRSKTHPDTYLLTVAEQLPDGEMETTEVFPMDWRQVEVLNREIVSLRVQDAERYADEEATRYAAEEAEVDS